MVTPHLLFRNPVALWKQKHNFVHLNLCIALLIASIIFVVRLGTAEEISKVSLLYV